MKMVKSWYGSLMGEKVENMSGVPEETE